MKRRLLTLRYIGTHYHGWQVQPNGITVQETLQNALEQVLGVRPGVTGCSRTDSGVHANQFCCHFDSESAMESDRLIRALNAHLPKDIAVYGCADVPADFHARYSCKGKNYLYQFYNGIYRNPFYEGLAASVYRPLDEALLDEAAKSFLGTHDFSGFCSSGGSAETTVRTVAECSVSRRGELVILSITADGFLYHMVRIIAGTLLYVQQEKIPKDALPDIIRSKERSRAGATAPACGLYLNRVFYE